MRIGSAFLRAAATVLIAVPGTATVARAQYHFDSWSIDNGLPQGSIYTMLQTRDGYLWMTTFDGIVRFDGVRFATFNRANAPGLVTNRFTALHEDRDGDLWIGTESAGIVRYRHGQFETFPIEGGRVRGLVRAIAGDRDGHLWVLLDGETVEWNGGHFRRLTTTGFPSNSYFGREIVSRGATAGFWTTNERGLELFVRRSVMAVDGLKSRIHDVAEDQHGQIWVAGEDGVGQLDGAGITRRMPTGECAAGKVTRFVARSDASLVCYDREGRLLMIDPASGERRLLGRPPAEFPDDLQSTRFYEDREGHVWIGTDGRGLYRVRRHLVTTYSVEEGLIDRNVYPVLEDHAGAIWLGTWPRTLSRIKDGRVTNYSAEHGLTGEPITSLFEDRDGRLWVGAYGNLNGLRVLERGRFVSPNVPRDLGVVKAMFQDRDGAMWLGTDERLLRLHHGVASAYGAMDGMASGQIQVIVERAAGGLWVGGTRGLTLVKDGTFTAFTERSGLPSDNVRALYEDAAGVLWVGTYDGGLARLSSGRFTHYSTRDGLFDNGVFQILEDDRGDLWMSCNRGIYRVSKRELNELAAGTSRTVTSAVYGTSDGMRSPETNGAHAPAGVKARDGTLWFPTQNGVVRIDPRSLPRSAPPATRIESCLVDRQTVPLDTAVRLNPRHTDLEISYTAMSLTNSDRIRFRYKLEGLNRDWVEAGMRRTAYYAQLPAGRYTFTVIAASGEGVWGTQGSSIALVVLPAFYRTWWFITVVVTGVAGLIALMWLRREAWLKRAHLAQQAFSRQLIASEEAERKRIAAELHDSLGQRLVIIKNFAMLAANSATDGVRERLQEISAEASHAITEVREIAQNLRPYHLDRLGLTKALDSLVRKAADASTIEFAADLDPIDGVFQKSDEINVYRVVQESVNNVLKHSHATRASVIVRHSPSSILLTIQDNGRGFAPSASDDHHPAAGGFGLTGIMERVTLLGGRAEIESRPDQGTTITITFELTEAGRAPEQSATS